MIIQYRRLKRYSNAKNLVEMAYLVEWKEPHGESPIVDELQNFDSVQWQCLGYLCFTDAEWEKFKIHWQGDECYFTDDLKGKLDAN